MAVDVGVSSRMRAVRRSNTDAELALQTGLRQRRVKFVAHERVLGCRPDVVLTECRVAVFVDGDFWHGRQLVELGLGALTRSFRTRRSFWVAKIARNVARDWRQTCRLRRHGWSVLRLWEKEVLRQPAAAAAQVARRVNERDARQRRRDAA